MGELNKWLVLILWIKIVFTTLWILGQLWEMFTNLDSINLLSSVNIIFAICAVVGAYLLINENKNGFYMVVCANIAIAILLYYQFTQISVVEYGVLFESARQSALNCVWVCLGQIAILMLLMLLKGDGKNAYQLLWGE